MDIESWWLSLSWMHLLWLRLISVCYHWSWCNLWLGDFNIPPWSLCLCRSSMDWPCLMNIDMQIVLIYQVRQSATICGEPWTLFLNLVAPPGFQQIPEMRPKLAFVSRDQRWFMQTHAPTSKNHWRLQKAKVHRRNCVMQKEGWQLKLTLIMIFIGHAITWSARYRFGRSASWHSKMGMPQRSYCTINSNDGHYFPYPALHSNGHSRNCNCGVSALADVRTLLHGERVSNGGAAWSGAV